MERQSENNKIVTNYENFMVNLVRAPGFSIPYVDKSNEESYSITTSYVRLVDDTPIMKIELLGDDFTHSDMMKIMNMLSGESVGE